MPADKIVVNASPLIILCKGDLEELLPQLFQKILIPQAVYDEIRAGDDEASAKVASAPWLEVIQVSTLEDVTVWNLGAGESEVLSFAISDPGIRAVIDDRAARICAKTLSIPALGTGAILVLAKMRGLIESVSRSLSDLEAAGLYISPSIAQTLVEQAGE